MINLKLFKTLDIILRAVLKVGLIFFFQRQTLNPSPLTCQGNSRQLSYIHCCFALFSFASLCLALFFLESIPLNRPGQPPTFHIPASAFVVAGITGMSHHIQHYRKNIRSKISFIQHNKSFCTYHNEYSSLCSHDYIFQH